MSAENSDSSGRRLLTGRVVSNKMDKTVAVEVVRRVKHPKYEKYVNRRNVLSSFRSLVLSLAPSVGLSSSGVPTTVDVRVARLACRVRSEDL